MQGPESAPPAHAAWSASRSGSVQRFCSVGVTGIVTAPGQVGYGAGQVFCWFEQRTGFTRPLQVEFAAVQLAHATPPEPHALFAKPTAQVVDVEQQPPQLPGPQGTWQVRLPGLHTRPFAVQSEHAAPPPPHEVSPVPMTQVFPWQQPAQLPGPQAGSWQVPAWHTRCGFWPEQFSQLRPPRPHAVFWLPAAQRLPMQQPLQVAGLHVAAGWQTPALHASFGAHAKHAWPPLPQAAGVVAITQLLPAQQPGQFAALQVTGVSQTRVVPLHVWPVAVQLRHAAPRVPHAVESAPVTQVLPLQQPLQLAGPQVGVPTQRPPLPLDWQVWPWVAHEMHCWPA